MTDPSLIRNFSIIAHIDHGKSTLADRILQLTRTISEREMKDQVLDSMELERERGITIKAQAVRVLYEARDGRTYTLNLIDTPGHVDFTYEVSRSLAACEGVLLLVDAAQGVEAQTVANAMLSINAGLETVPVINKVDLPSAEPDRVKKEIEEAVALPSDDAILTSGKTGEGVEAVLETVVSRVPPPVGDPDAPLKALIFDSYFDTYRGVVAFVRVVDGAVAKGDRVLLMATGTKTEVEEVGVLTPTPEPMERLGVGEVGYLVCGVKEPALVKVGDTVTTVRNGAEEPLPGYRDVKPMVFTGIFPIDGDQYPELRDALDKLKLNDPSLVYEPENSHALGFGFRCGFLGLLHTEIVKERLEREFDLELLATAPSVEYRVTKTDGTELSVHSPTDLPDVVEIEEIAEPYLRATVLVPPDFVGAIMDLAEGRRADFLDMQYLSEHTVEMHYEIPLSEIILDFYDQLKSRTRGYASLDYEHIGYRPSDLVKLDILLAGKPVDALSFIVHKDKAYDRGRTLAERLREIIPRQMFDVPIQAAVGGRIIARETVRAKRKDVLAKCYGGDVSRKRKLLEKQKKGKKRMKAVGTVEVPQEAFMAILKVDE
jgi:GTP-binding protein LepA